MARWLKDAVRQRVCSRRESIVLSLQRLRFRIVSPTVDEQITMLATAQGVGVLARNRIPPHRYIATVLLDISRAFCHIRRLLDSAVMARNSRWAAANRLQARSCLLARRGRREVPVGLPACGKPGRP